MVWCCSRRFSSCCWSECSEPAERPALVVIGIAFLVPFNLVMLAMSNTLFLIYPVRLTPGTSADFQMVGA